MMSYTGNVIGDIPFGQGRDNDGARSEEELGAILRHPSSGVVAEQLVERALSREPDNKPFDQDSPPLMVRIIDDENDPVSYFEPSGGIPYFELPDQEMPTTEDAPGNMWPKIIEASDKSNSRNVIKRRRKIAATLAATVVTLGLNLGGSRDFLIGSFLKDPAPQIDDQGFCRVGPDSPYPPTPGKPGTDANGC
jgi:hypothetical protein